MNTDEIRSLNHDCQKEINETKTEKQHRFGIDSLNYSMLTEVAAQLAELNEKLKNILSPPLMYDKVDIDPVDFSGLSNQRITVMEARATLRDQFAMAALVNMCNINDVTHETIAHYAYHIADAMMEARK
jgi:hypothetical protein